MNKILFIIGVIILSGCTNVRYENSINISAPKDLVFGILEDYKNYPILFPIFILL
jgi:hypothetical protein